MAQNKNAYTRYKLIDECIRKGSSNNKITKDFLAAYILKKEGIRVSERQISTDIQTLKSKLFDAPIEFNRKNGFHYTDKAYSILGLNLTSKEIEHLKDSVSMLKQFSGLNFGNKLHQILETISTVDYSKNEEFILLDQPTINNGSEHLELLLNYIKRKQCIEFIYVKHHSNENAKKRIVLPLALKEYAKQWYLVCFDNEPKVIKSYALDRIKLLSKSSVKIKIDNAISAQKHYEHSFGITSKANENIEPSIIQLKVSQPCYDYLKQRPWHHSQQIEKDNLSTIIVRFKLYESIELEKEILSWGESVIVLEPKSLRDSIRKKLKAVLKKYEQS